MKGTRSQRAWHNQDDFPDLPSSTTSPPQTPTTGSATLREPTTVDPTGSRDPPLAWGSHETPLLAQQDPEEVSSIASSNTPTKGDQLEEESMETPSEKELLAELVHQAVQLTRTTSPLSQGIGAKRANRGGLPRVHQEGWPVDSSSCMHHLGMPNLTRRDDR